MRILCRPLRGLGILRGPDPAASRLVDADINVDAALS